MPINTLNQLNSIVAIGGGHGLGRIMSSLSFLGPRLTGIVTTTDNGGSTGRIRRDEGGIAWGDVRNCINQLITEPSIASTMFEYRFSGNGELAGHNLGNLMLKALDNLSIRPLDAINLIRELLNVKAQLIPMTEMAADLVAIDCEGKMIHGEVNVDKLEEMPQQLQLDPPVLSTKEAIHALQNADLILIGPGSFMTSLMPPLLLNEIALTLQQSTAYIIYINNLAKEQSPAAANLALFQKINLLESAIGGRKIDAILVSPQTNTEHCHQHLIIQQHLEATDIPYRHNRELLRQALERALKQLTIREHSFSHQ